MVPAVPVGRGRPVHPAYAILAFGLARLALLRSRNRSRDALLEVAVVVLGVGSILWLYLMAPYATDSSIPLSTRLVTLAYPSFDLVLVAIVATFVILPGARSRAYWLLLGGLIAALAGGTIYAVTSLTGAFAYGQPYFILWIVFYALFGAAVLHPSMRALADSSRPDELPRGRAWAMPIALTLPLLALALNEFDEGDSGATAVAAALTVAVLLVGLRQARLFRQVAERERSRPIPSTCASG